MTVDALQDVVIVGGGFAGSAAALTLGRSGHKVTLIDISAPYPPLFRAEKVDDDQLALLQQCGLLDLFTSVATLTSDYINIRGGIVIDRPHVRDYAMSYADMVDLLRKNMPGNVSFIRGRVSDIETGPDRQRVIIAGGAAIETRLAVIATGQGDILRRKLGFESRQTHPLHTISVAFSLQPPAGGFRFPALTAYGQKCGDGVDYISIFRLGDGLRANLFFFAGLKDPRIKKLREKPLETVLELLPGLRPWIGDCRLADKVAVFPVELSRCVNASRDGVVLIGDSFRASCPSVGTGLTCVLTDVVRLRYHVAEWLKTPGMAAAKLASFYADPVKIACDENTYRRAVERRNHITKKSFIHCLRRTAHFTRRALFARLRFRPR